MIDSNLVLLGSPRKQRMTVAAAAVSCKEYNVIVPLFGKELLLLVFGYEI